MAEKRSALVVATSEYEDARLAPLAGPGRDAEELQRVLADAEIGGFDVQLALNKPLFELRTMFDSFFADRDRDELLLVHFSGHGLKDDDGQLYLAAADTRIDRLMSTAVEAGWVNRLMTKCRSDKIALFLDCCFGGAFTTGLTRRAGVDTAGSKETFSGTGRFVITASDAMQYSFEGGERVTPDVPEPSPFTRALVEGLTTGDADRNDDGFVSINELFDYLEDRVRQLSPAQTPTKSAFNQVGDWIIAQSMRGPTIRILPASLQDQLKSDAPRDRMAAAFTLRDLIAAGDPRVGDAAQKALERLTADDSRLVAEAAERLFGRMADGDAPAGTVTSTPLSTSDLPPTIITALGGTPARPDATPMPTPAPLDATPPLTPQPRAPAAPAVLAAATVPSIPISAAIGTVQPASIPPGALWNPQPGGPSLAAAGSAAGPLVAAVPAQAPSKVPWSLRRSIGRAAVGSFLAVMAQFFVLMLSNQPLMQDEAALAEVSAVFSAIALPFTFGSAIVAATAEGVVPPLRIAAGSGWRFVRNNRWLATGIAGLVIGLTLGLGIEAYVIYEKFGTTDAADLGIVLYTALGWLGAEAIFGRAARAPQTDAASG